MNILPEQTVMPPRTIFRRGAAATVLADCCAHGNRGLLVHGNSLNDNGMLSVILGGCPASCDVFTWKHSGDEPRLVDVRGALAFARGHKVDWVAGVGGGSVLDLAKTCAGLFDSSGDPAMYHDGHRIEGRGIPFIALPTTAGTGSEATIVTVLTNEATGEKKSIRGPQFMARLVVLDAGLLAGTPRMVIADSGMDALTQAIESFVSLGSTWFTDQLALRAFDLVAHGIRDAWESEGRRSADEMLAGSYLAGCALSNARLGLVHGLAHPLGARYHVPHGRACAVCLPAVLTFNLTHMHAKYETLSRCAGADLQEFVGSLLAGFGMISPFAGKAVADRDAVIRETLASGSTKSNPRPVTAADVDALLTRLFA